MHKHPQPNRYNSIFSLQIDPPLGFGSKCPDLLAYKRLVRMNMPVDEEGKVHFKSTLFSLIRINLQIFMRSMEEMDQADQELRAAIQKSWPSTRGGKIQSQLPESMGEKFQIGFSHGNQVGKHISYPFLLTRLLPGKVGSAAKCQSFSPAFATANTAGCCVQQNARLAEIWTISPCLP